MKGRNWPECGQSFRGCTFLALSGLRMTHSRAKPLKGFPSSDLEICPTQQLTKTQLQAHPIKLPSFCSFSSKILASCCVGVRTSLGQKDKGLFTWPGYCLHGWSHTLVCGLCEESSFFSPPLPIHTQNESSSRHRKYNHLCDRLRGVVIKSVGLGIYHWGASTL